MIKVSERQNLSTQRKTLGKANLPNSIVHWYNGTHVGPTVYMTVIGCIYMYILAGNDGLIITGTEVREKGTL